jgi:MOSC domain-containing protein
MAEASQDGTAIGLVADLMRFPVKSLGGERLRRGFFGPFGLIGDRRHAVADGRGEALSARRAPALLGYRARAADRESGEGAEVETPRGRRLSWDDPELARELSAALGRPVRLEHSPLGVFDAAPVHLVSDASLGAVEGWLEDEIDRRRFRPNLVVETAEGRPFAEDAWVGRRLAVGDALVLEVVSPTERCVVTTIDPDTGERDKRVLAALARERDNLFGVYARVASPGWAAVGDEVRLAGPPG